MHIQRRRAGIRGSILPYPGVCCPSRNDDSTLFRWSSVCDFVHLGVYVILSGALVFPIAPTFHPEATATIRHCPIRPKIYRFRSCVSEYAWVA